MKGGHNRFLLERRSWTRAIIVGASARDSEKIRKLQNASPVEIDPRAEVVTALDHGSHGSVVFYFPSMDMEVTVGDHAETIRMRNLGETKQVKVHVLIEQADDMFAPIHHEIVVAPTDRSKKPKLSRYYLYQVDVHEYYQALNIHNLRYKYDAGAHIIIQDENVLRPYIGTSVYGEFQVLDCAKKAVVFNLHPWLITLEKTNRKIQKVTWAESKSVMAIEENIWCDSMPIFKHCSYIYPNGATYPPSHFVRTINASSPDLQKIISAPAQGMSVNIEADDESS